MIWSAVTTSRRFVQEARASAHSPQLSTAKRRVWLQPARSGGVGGLKPRPTFPRFHLWRDQRNPSASRFSPEMGARGHTSRAAYLRLRGQGSSWSHHLSTSRDDVLLH